MAMDVMRVCLLYEDEFYSEHEIMYKKREDAVGNRGHPLWGNNLRTTFTSNNLDGFAQINHSFSGVNISLFFHTHTNKFQPFLKTQVKAALLQTI